ncbi:MAG TPA: DNA-3-methyladenine glycosylase I [Ornithinibacter sp.]|nr:DNA-3-methyladenine glycosylase I [Ornithinibacter sp.]HQD69087.1 DNA-3-methyladenine glycosylase I [Ornithinibacter sp.]
MTGTANAQTAVALASEGVDLGELVWSFRPADPTAPSQVYPSQCVESVALSKELKRRGFSFVGPVTVYAARNIERSTIVAVGPRLTAARTPNHRRKSCPRSPSPICSPSPASRRSRTPPPAPSSR